jgi:formyl-CoA transferase
MATGKGQHVDASLLDSAIAYTVYESSSYFATGQIAQAKGSAHQMLAPYQAFETEDGYINIGAANQANWERMCRAVGREDLLEDPRFASNALRMVNIADLTPIMDDTFSRGTTSHWVEVLEREGVPCGPIYNIKQVYDDPHVQARNMRVELDHPIAGRIGNIGVPIKLSDTPGTARTAAPVLGQHTKEVLSEYDYTEGDIEAIKASGAIG